MDEMNAITEQVLYVILNTDGEIKTSSICSKFEYRDTLVKSQLDQLRDRGMVEADKHPEYQNMRATNYYSTRPRASEYRDEYGLSVPKYVLRQEFDEWVKRDDNWKDIAEKRIKALETRADEKDKEVEQLKKRVKQLEENN